MIARLVSYEEKSILLQSMSYTDRLIFFFGLGWGLVGVGCLVKVVKLWHLLSLGNVKSQSGKGKRKFFRPLLFLTLKR